jgi:hypothetical protein
MPEQLTKHPDVTLQVLRSAGAQCGAGAPQDILKACPAERFCKLPGGEVCIYGLSDVAQMTQISPSEWQAALRQVTPSLPAAPASAAASSQTPNAPAAVTSGVALLLLGVAVGWWLRR